MKITIINGPNLNLLGSRETKIYGSQNFESYLGSLRASFPKITIEYFQSNIEGEIINKIHESKEFDGIILNAAAYTHTSIGIADAVKSIDCKVIEVHISNTYSREEFRHNSFLSPVVDGIIIGFGLNSYKLGIESLVN
ncbi:3-dehydroquinate dehydratase [Flavobacteriaceae bacterium]|nr:3-dehydroquinate dehydratase [Flavobacteriaceae bacterium]